MNENTMKLIQDGKALFTAAVGRVDPAKMVEQFVSCEGDRLSVKNEQETVDYNLSDFHQVIVIGAGKASAKMALGLEAVLSKKISNGLVVVKTGHTEKLQYIDLLEAAHPIPDESCVTAANKIADLCREADENTLIINLISGGGSALLTAPYQGGDHLLTLDDIQRVTGLLLLRSSYPGTQYHTKAPFCFTRRPVGRACFSSDHDQSYSLRCNWRPLRCYCLRADCA